MHTLARVGERDVLLRPAAVAMVWNAPGAAHAQVAVPGVRLSAGEALAEVELATICGSDVHTVRGERSATTPLVLGHEQVGRIVAVGEDARRADGSPLLVGDRVIWSVTVSCGACDRCVRGLTQACRSLAKYGHERVHRGWELSGGFATHVHLRAGTAIVPVDGSVPAAVLAPVSCATATAVAAIEAASAHLPLNDVTVLITGAGMLGLTLTALASDAGAHVIVVEPDEQRRELALQFGAVAALDSRRSQARLREAIGAAGPDPDALVAIEASGAESGVRACLSSVGVGGIVVLLGSVSPGGQLCVDPESLVSASITVRGVRDYTADQLVRAAAYLSSAWRRHPFGDLVSEGYSLTSVDAALGAAAAATAVRVAVRP
ncbi:alcohol dehydrogenase catalytic domain-containing protein [Rathayibacter sp. YIM 133350]|uniref:alcohol dehydrogenase catalytic domain-containing protein n=1 Tax=Rathayibacter sp. YIM 133350 TaxID=3131992 RepID=UPI00307F8E2E